MTPKEVVQKGYDCFTSGFEGKIRRTKIQR